MSTQGYALHRRRAVSRWLLTIALAAVAAIAVALPQREALAIAEGDVQFSVTQAPAGGATVQVGSTFTLDVAMTVTTAPIGIPLYFEYDYPAGLSFVIGASTPPGVVCTDNSPLAGIVRCDYNVVTPGPRVPLTLTFQVNASVTTAAAQAVVRAGASDGGPDPASDGDDSFTGAGVITVFGPGLVSAGGSGAPAAVFEGSSTTYTVLVENTTPVATGAFTASVVFTNGVVTGVTCATASVPNGAGSGAGTPVATCTGSTLSGSEVLAIEATVAAANTPGGADITAAISAPALGISQAGSPVVVQEVGLRSTAGALTAGQPVNVCTDDVATDTADAAAGSAQPHDASLIGQVSSNILLQLSDFQVTGSDPGTITAATGCAPNQSGVRFTPATAGTYTVTALYNAGGANALALTVGGGASNPVPAISLLSPSTASAGGPQFTLTVTGTGFVSGDSVVHWNGTPLATTFGNSTSLTATVPAANIASATTANVTVVTAGPGGGPSNARPFTVSAAPNPVPAVSALSPNTIGAGAAQFTMTVTGTNFVSGAVVRWNGADLPTTYVSATSLTATVAASHVASAGAANVTVVNPPPGGGSSVTPATFTITASAAKLAFTTQPGAGVAGSALAAQPVVAVQTAAGATVTSDSTTVVTLALNGAGTLICTGGLTRTAAAGVATFAGCSVTPAATGYTITATATGLTSATSGAFDVSVAPPTTSTQVTVSNPSNAPIPRSRLSFAVSTGSIDASAVSFIIKRKADGKYFNVTSGEWQTELVLNTAVHGGGTAWSLAISGEARREFAGTIVTLEARVTAGSTVYVNATIPELSIR